MSMGWRGAGGRTTMRIFPNPQSSDAMVRANQSVAVPGEASIKVGNGPETVACFASDNDPILTAGREALGRGFEVEPTALSTIRGADRILVFEDGRIVEEGRHTELVKKGGAYARLHAVTEGWD